MFFKTNYIFDDKITIRFTVIAVSGCGENDKSLFHQVDWGTDSLTSYLFCGYDQRPFSAEFQFCVYDTGPQNQLMCINGH
jgi:hypothetical protein